MLELEIVSKNSWMYIKDTYLVDIDIDLGNRRVPAVHGSHHGAVDEVALVRSV